MVISLLLTASHCRCVKITASFGRFCSNALRILDTTLPNKSIITASRYTWLRIRKDWFLTMNLLQPQFMTLRLLQKLSRIVHVLLSLPMWVMLVKKLQHIFLQMGYQLWLPLHPNRSTIATFFIYQVLEANIEFPLYIRHHERQDGQAVHL